MLDSVAYLYLAWFFIFCFIYPLHAFLVIFFRLEKDTFFFCTCSGFEPSPSNIVAKALQLFTWLHNQDKSRVCCMALYITSSRNASFREHRSCTFLTALLVLPQTQPVRLGPLEPTLLFFSMTFHLALGDPLFFFSP